MPQFAFSNVSTFTNNTWRSSRKKSTLYTFSLFVCLSWWNTVARSHYGAHFTMMLTRMLPARSLRACCQPSVAHFSSSVAARAAPEIQPMQLPPMSSVVPNSCLTFEEHTIFSAGRFSPRLNVEHLVGEYKVMLLHFDVFTSARIRVLLTCCCIQTH